MEIATKFIFCFQETINIDEPFLLRICALHRVPPEWDHDEYKVSLQIYHGTRPIVEPLQTEHRSLLKEESGMGNDRVVFDQYLETEESNVKIISLPREARIVLTLSSKSIVTEEKQRKVVTSELGWAALQLFDFERLLVQGTFLLNLWPPEAEKQVGPAPGL